MRSKEARWRWYFCAGLQHLHCYDSSLFLLPVPHRHAGGQRCDVRLDRLMTGICLVDASLAGFHLYSGSHQRAEPTLGIREARRRRSQ